MIFYFRDKYVTTPTFHKQGCIFFSIFFLLFWQKSLETFGSKVFLDLDIVFSSKREILFYLLSPSLYNSSACHGQNRQEENFNLVLVETICIIRRAHQGIYFYFFNITNSKLLTLMVKWILD